MSQNILLSASCQGTLCNSSIPFLPPLGTQCKHSASCHRNPTLMLLLQYSYSISYTFT